MKETNAPGEQLQPDSADLLAQLAEARQQASDLDARLQQSESRWNDFIERTDDLVTQVDDQGRMLYVNRAAKRVFGVEPNACLGQPAFEFVHPDDRESTMATFAGWVGQRVASASFENRQVSRDGAVRHMLWTVNPCYDESGSVECVWSIARDITAHKRTAAELQQHRDHLEEMVAERTSDLEREIESGRLREQTIDRQNEDILELSTPVMQVWDGVVVAPLIGSLDSQRTQRFMEVLLESIVATGSSVALVDITGVPTIDTQTAQYLIESVAAVRLLGSQVVLTGVRPAIAQTLVQLGIDLSDVETCSSLAAGLKLAIEQGRRPQLAPERLA